MKPDRIKVKGKQIRLTKEQLEAKELKLTKEQSTQLDRIAKKLLGAKFNVNNISFGVDDDGYIYEVIEE